jgi:hypothetical protein
MYCAGTTTGSLVSSSRTMTGSHVDNAKTRTAHSVTQDEGKVVATQYDDTMYDNDTVTKSDHMCMRRQYHQNQQQQCCSIFGD